MRYFDSPKNRAMWNKELEGLKAEKERRREEGYKPQTRDAAGKSAAAAEKSAERPGRKRVSLKELEAAEKASGGVRKVRRPSRQHTRSLSAEKSAPKAQNGKVM